MGWMGTDRYKGQTQLDYFAPKYNYSKPDGSYGKCIAAASTLQACYIAYEEGDATVRRE